MRHVKRLNHRRDSDTHSPTISFMRLFVLVLAAAAGVSLLMPTSVDAQAYQTGGGYGVGHMQFGAFNPGQGAELSLDPGVAINLFGEYWTPSPRAGFRINGLLTRRPLVVSDDTHRIRTWAIDGSLMLRPLPARETRVVAPFVSIGAGMFHYGLGRTGRPVIATDAEVVYPGADEAQWAGVVGGGIDILPASLRLFETPLGIRLEVANHTVFQSPFQSLDGDRLGPLHNLRFSIGLIGMGW